MTGEQLQGWAALAAAVIGPIGGVATVWLQLRQNKMSRSNADKLDEQGAKIDEVHRSTAALVEATGTHKVLPDPNGPQV